MDTADHPAKRPHALRDRWSALTRSNAWLGRRLKELRTARDPQHPTALWIKTAGLLATVALLPPAVRAITTWASGLPTTIPQGNGILATLDDPVRAYLTHHAEHLPLTPFLTYATWQLAGICAFFGGWLLRSTSARCIWTLWGATNIAMIWTATPAQGRPITVCLALLAWTALSTWALQGLTLRPLNAQPLHVHNHLPSPAVRTEVHLPPTPPAASASTYLRPWLN